MPLPDLHGPLLDRVKNYLRGDVPLSELSDWISRNVQQLATSEGNTYRLYDLVTAYEAEYSIGLIDEGEMRYRLSAELDAHLAPSGSVASADLELRLGQPIVVQSVWGNAVSPRWEAPSQQATGTWPSGHTVTLHRVPPAPKLPQHYPIPLAPAA